MKKEITINELGEILKSYFGLLNRPVITKAWVGGFKERAYKLGPGKVLTIQYEYEDEYQVSDGA